MAIEKMIMVDLVGHIEDINKVSKKVVLSESIHQVNAYQEIDSSNFKISATEENQDTLIDVCNIRPYAEMRENTNIASETKKLKEMCSFKDQYSVSTDELIMDYEVLSQKVKEVSCSFESVFERLRELKIQKGNMEKYARNLSYLKNMELPIEELVDLTKFSFEMNKIPKENVHKLKENYENVPSIIIIVSEDKDSAIIISFTPNILKIESDRIFKSLYCEPIELPREYSGTPIQVCKLLNERIIEIEKDIVQLTKELKNVSKENAHLINIIDRSMELENKSLEVRSNIARTNEAFYLCGWVPEGSFEKFIQELECFGDRLIITKRDLSKVNNPNVTPPTKLKNHSLVRPFETMVGMYGIPSYNEIDPTTFLGISYMLMFGMMFGDVGQGMVFVLAGLFMQFKKNSPNIGGILTRLGISSTIFGFVYGSVFGFETVIPALVIRPMENITQLLVFAVIFGCILILISFMFSLINNFKKRDLEDGVFGKDGVAGLTFYILILLFAFTKLKNISIMPQWLWITIFVVLLLLILLKEPVANLILNIRPLFKEGKGDYFIENGFGITETIMSLFSNTISFIRVGAFALNHVGLFIAFETLAHMVNNSVGSVVIYVFGNMLIIGLEGLIVFIQGLRLEYYELFSKYYEGAGIEFEPVKITEDNRLSMEKNIDYKMEKNFVMEN